MKQNVISCTSKLQTRFNDLDMAGHVHNSEYLNYFEIGRIEFFKQAEFYYKGQVDSTSEYKWKFKD